MPNASIFLSLVPSQSKWVQNNKNKSKIKYQNAKLQLKNQRFEG
jgi:hypothetical protein